jgi:nucleoside triphosphate diphosphatase
MRKPDNPLNDEIAESLIEFVEIVHRLRAPGGCPWDRKQTPETLKQYVIEEAYEVVDAIDGGTSSELCEELGDLLLQIGLQSEIAREKKIFTIADVTRGISQKLVNRHPHVFGDVRVETTDQVLTNWEQLKKKEKKGRGLFDGLPSQLPALQKSARIGEKSARVGFDWKSIDGVREKVSEELGELDAAILSGDPKEIEHELGDLLFSVAQLGRHLGMQPEEALNSCCKRFAERFKKLEREVSMQKKSLDELESDELDRIWQMVKRS